MKSFENYDKVTTGDKVVDKLKVLGLGFAGAIVGSLPYVVLLACGISSIFSLILSGAAAMVFYAAFGHYNGKNIIDHLILLFDTLFATFAVWCMTYVYHYSPMWSIEGLEMNDFQKLFYAMKHAKLDSIEGLYLITDGGYLSFWTCVIAALIVAVVGMYIAFIIVLISNKGEAKKDAKN